jgi:hypothetical protein
MCVQLQLHRCPSTTVPLHNSAPPQSVVCVARCGLCSGGRRLLIFTRLLMYCQVAQALGAAVVPATGGVFGRCRSGDALSIRSKQVLYLGKFESYHIQNPYGGGTWSDEASVQPVH